MKTIHKLLLILVAMLSLSSRCLANTEISDIEDIEGPKNRREALTCWMEEFSHDILGSTQDFAFDLFLKLAEKGWWSFAIVAAVLLLSVAAIVALRRVDRGYKRVWIYYPLFFVTLLPTWGLFSVSWQLELMFDYDIPYFYNLLLFAVTLVPGVLTIFGGWGIRECGMERGVRHKNFNRYIGQFLLFPVWIMFICLFWDAAFTPIIDWTGGLADRDGGFWLWMLTLVGGYFIMEGICRLWILIIALCLETAGNWPILIMTITLWMALVWISFNWICAAFWGFGYFCIFLLGGICMLGFLFRYTKSIIAMRCPMCHFCGAELTGLVDEGVSYSTSTRWESMDDSDVSRRHSGSIVTDASRLVRTTVGTESWTTEHTCPRCASNWNMYHSREVSNDSEVLREEWTEHYK
ncbi:MAG: hypothetical protein IKV29_04035 [Alistipes sp.]|nr:hypothetical protein [Alistipes sp.]